jgi:hypothetical protein
MKIITMFALQKVLETVPKNTKLDHVIISVLIFVIIFKHFIFNFYLFCVVYFYVILFCKSFL